MCTLPQEEFGEEWKSTGGGLAQGTTDTGTPPPDELPAHPASHEYYQWYQGYVMPHASRAARAHARASTKPRALLAQHGRRPIHG